MAVYVSAEDAIGVIKSGYRLYLHSVAAAPQVLISALVAQADRLRNVEIVHLHTEGPAPYTDPKYAENFRVNSLFIGGNIRKAVQEGRADYTPVFLSDIPNLFRSRVLDIDVALIQVSPPDRHGFCSLRTTIESAHEALLTAENPQMPRTHGDGMIHESSVTYFVDGDAPLPEKTPVELTRIERAIGRNVATLIEDGATLQTGIGAIPDAVLSELTNHRDLGIHTEMFSDGAVDLVERGIITGRCKTIHRDKIIATFVMGTKRVYDFVNDNPMVNMLDVQYVNNPSVIARNHKMIAINSAIEVDITGQVCADSIGPMPYSGFGGQVDFMRGTALCQGGKPIIALPSRTNGGTPRIVSMLKQGAGVVTTRGHVHYVVTEFGIAYLHGKTMRDRARAMIDIAHPDDREQLERIAVDLYRLPV
jgi:acyl-CoA hydrolase